MGALSAPIRANVTRAWALVRRFACPCSKAPTTHLHTLMGDQKLVTPQQRSRDYTGLALVWGSLLFLAIAACSYLDSIRVSKYHTHIN